MARLDTGPLAGALTALMLAASMTANAQSPLHGIRFAFDTLESPPAWRGALTRLNGVVEFASGRGRLSVTAVRAGPAVALNGVTITSPIAKAGDYYLFDSTGFILVRPSRRTFSSFVLTRADFHQGGGLLPGAFLIKNTPIHTDTLVAGDASRLVQHGRVAIHWHLDSLDARGPRRIYARGWLEVLDTPAVEAGVVRWFGVAAALATVPGGVSTLPRNALQITTVALLYPRAEHDLYVRYLALLNPLGLTAVEIDPSHLVLPAGYRETRWPGFERAPGLRSPLPDARTKWRRLTGAPGPVGR